MEPVNTNKMFHVNITTIDSYLFYLFDTIITLLTIHSFILYFVTMVSHETAYNTISIFSDNA